ncbi:MAG: hypothetical protein HKN11_03205 [Rhizobiales bacterium]|nr:hypothetical protein [Hyphomicrobiales bacterium]
MPNFFVHVGAHKTGTCAFQKWLQLNRPRLFDAGLIAPHLGGDRLGNYRPFMEALAGPTNLTQRTQKRIIKSLLKEVKRSPNHDVIISSEYFFNPKFENHREEFSEQLKSIGHNRFAILIVRDQYTWVNSIYCQRRQTLFDVPDTLEAYVAQMIRNNRGNWANTAEEIDKLGFDLTTLPYTREFQAAGIVKNIMSIPALAGRVAVSIEESTLRENESMGATGLIIADQVKARALEIAPELTPNVRKELGKIVRTFVADRGLNDPKFNGLSPAVREMIASGYNDSNARFAKRYLEQSWCDLFPLNEHFGELSPRRIEDLDHRDAAIVKEICDEVLHRANELKLFN